MKTHARMRKVISKTDTVYKKLQKNIVEGKLPPGHRLAVTELVGEFGVSKTPIREALLRLKNEGLVKGSLHQVLLVAHLSSKDAAEIYDMREVLEGLAARSAAKKISPKGATELKALIRRSEEYCNRENIKALTQIDLQLHDLIAKMSENKRLCDTLKRFRNQTQILIRTSMYLLGKGGRQALIDHRRIVDAIVKKNPELAESRAREHIQKFREAVVRWLRTTGW